MLTQEKLFAFIFSFFYVKRKLEAFKNRTINFE